MKRNVWLTVHGEQQYEGMSADSSDLRVRGTMEETRDGYLLRYEETDGDGKVTTATRLALAPDCIILTRTGRGDERDGLCRRGRSTPHSMPCPTEPCRSQ